MAYFPNSSAGEVLDSQCAQCPLGDGPCPVASVQLLYNYDQLEDGQEKLQSALTTLVDEAGICQVRRQLMEVITVVNQEG